MTTKQVRAQLTQGIRVKVTPEAHWYKAVWFPVGEVTGMVEKVNSRGRIDVAVDQLPMETHQHGRRTLQFKPAEIAEII